MNLLYTNSKHIALNPLYIDTAEKLFLIGSLFVFVGDSWGTWGLVVMSILLVIMVLSRAWDFLGIYSAFLYIFCCIIIIKYFFCGGLSSCFLNLL